jgi:hypothetical protein
MSAALIAEGVVFGTFRLDDPGGILLTVEVAIGALLPIFLLGRRERLAGYGVTVVLALLGGILIGPVTTLVRGIADRF